jgi:hypothetical protein
MLPEKDWRNQNSQVLICALHRDEKLSFNMLL